MSLHKRVWLQYQTTKTISETYFVGKHPQNQTFDSSFGTSVVFWDHSTSTNTGVEQLFTNCLLENRRLTLYNMLKYLMY